jgi:two-component system, sensor histidine kinase
MMLLHWKIKDMQMPVMDGIDATKFIVQREGGHRIPLVVFVTAHVSASFEAQCLESGATAYLPKPYTLQLLTDVLQETAAKLK